MTKESKHLPEAKHWSRFLDGGVLWDQPIVAKYLSQTLLQPVRELTQRPHKSIRAQLVRIGAQLSYEVNTIPFEAAVEHAATEETLAALGAAIEYLHGGSLIVDDIQDGSLHRRGRPAIHRIFGTSQAIAAGNWMYFYPLSIIRQLGVTDECKQRLYEAFHDATLTAHEGQALDVSLRVSELPQSDVPRLSGAVMDLKTGSLTALGLALGAIVNGLRGESLQQLMHFGRRFGIALQMFDDVGNLASQNDPEKSMEDLRNQRISFVWGFAAKQMPADLYKEFLQLVDRLPDSAPMWEFLRQYEFVSRAKQEAASFLQDSLDQLLGMWPQLAMPQRRAIKDLRSLGEMLNHAF